MKRDVPLSPRIVTLLILLVLVIIIMILLSKCSSRAASADTLQREYVKSGGDTLDIAIEFSPLSYYVSGDTVAGLDFELIGAMSRIAHRPVKFHPFSPLPSALQGLNDGLYDMVVSSLPATDSLRQKYSLTEPIYLDREVLVQLKDNERFVHEAQQLANDTVWMAHGSPFIRRIENLSSEIGEPIYIESPQGRTAEHLVMLVAKGEIPRAVVNAALAQKMRDTFYPDIDISTPISFTQLQCWIVSDNDAQTIRQTSAWIDSLTRSQQYADILNKYGVVAPVGKTVKTTKK